MALEQTSEEVLSSPTIGALPKETTAHLRSMLLRADLVKFAKYEPQKEEHDASFVSAKAFVEATVELEAGVDLGEAAPSHSQKPEVHS